MQTTLLLLLSEASSSSGELESVLRSNGVRALPLRSFEDIDVRTLIARERAAGILVELMAWAVPEQLMLKRIRQLAGQLPILVVSDDRDVGHAVSIIRSGATDYLPRPFSDGELIRRIESVLPRCSGRQLRIDAETTSDGHPSRLTRCERLVLDGVLSAKTTKQISKELQVGFQTVAKHKQSVLRKFGARNEVALVIQLLSGEPNDFHYSTN